KFNQRGNGDMRAPLIAHRAGGDHRNDRERSFAAGSDLEIAELINKLNTEVGLFRIRRFETRHILRC
ncbi:hypothetical protein DD571_32920, partial [Klebsiella pneumoniae]